MKKFSSIVLYSFACSVVVTTAVAVSGLRKVKSISNDIERYTNRYLNHCKTISLINGKIGVYHDLTPEQQKDRVMFFEQQRDTCLNKVLELML